ncbi:uncharacterized protein PHACADRAFT_250944 [Phanerochaete carnosa HHB-10118-sp]|uniref:Uncharacterized protein n=1 Tax=Phanerochaete carnosa (strain HHB-10118-sp) TaxID=650164 RepID=K5WLK7_PHACS|nr:uncharacterized protein PHACADRAFT_250944 [Phanerochaete carnosa HHB-10118-sp]EKM60074.1 hypothetical protein PHACADRAFT_250944 [Phanerochaete carnosa HHB-10118-sp]
MYFITSLVLALAATTAVSMPSPKARGEDRIARRARGKIMSRADPADNSQIQFNPFAAGAAVTGAAGTITGATGSFVATAPSVPEGEDPTGLYSFSSTVGIDWQLCLTGGVLSGVGSYIQNGSVTFSIDTSAFPSGSISPSDFIISEGDNITVSVTATNATSSTSVYTNQNTNQTISVVIASGTLCMAEADFIIDQLNTSLADFGTVDFTGVSAETAAGSLDLSGATIFEIQKHGTNLSTVSITNSSVQVTYL